MLNTLPSANIFANFTTVYASEEVMFHFIGNSGDEPSTYQWDFGDGTVNSTVKNPVHVYLEPGVYTVVLTVIDLNGDSDTISMENYITVLTSDPIDPPPEDQIPGFLTHTVFLASILGTSLVILTIWKRTKFKKV